MDVAVTCFANFMTIFRKNLYFVTLQIIFYMKKEKKRIVAQLRLEPGIYGFWVRRANHYTTGNINTSDS